MASSACLSVSLASRRLAVRARRLLTAQPVRQRMIWVRKHDTPLEDYMQTMEQKMAALKVVDPELDKEINIGLPYLRQPPNERKRLRDWLSSRVNKEKLARHRKLKVSLEEVRERWLTENGIEEQKQVAEHFGIYHDLYEDAFFYPVTEFKVLYDFNEELDTPVYFGNKIPASEVTKEPYVEFKADADSKWTLVMTCPDCHLQDSQNEYLHWMVGNIPGGEVDQGQVICNYMQPFPLRGIGYARYVFVLYKHIDNQHVDFSQHQRPPNCLSLEQRTFRTFDFYSQLQEKITPAGLAFFQSTWDPSVREHFQNVLGMVEPCYEFFYPPPYHPKQKRYPHKQAFNLYLDRYRDKKELAEEVILEKLRNKSPFDPPPKPDLYPNLQPLPRSLPSWVRSRERSKRLGRHRWAELHPDSQPPPHPLAVSPLQPQS